MQVFQIENNPQLITPKKLADGSEVLTLVEATLDTFLEEKFVDSEIRRDGLNISIFNATQTPKVGQKFARILSNYGGSILDVSNLNQIVEGCDVETISQNKSKKIIKLLESLGCQIKFLTEIEGVDVKVIVGDTWAKRWPETILP